MEETFVDWVYETLTDVLDEEYRLPEVENAFDLGKPCQLLYAEVYDAYSKLCEKYGVNYDEDAEKIIGSMSDICRELCYKMYEYGAKYGPQKKRSAE